MRCDSETILVAVLAGGDGRRIGGGKPGRLLGGRPLIDHALAAARGWSADVVVVGRTRAQLAAPGATFLRDAPGAEGPIAGLGAALRHAIDTGHGAVLTIPCDSPFLPADLAATLRAALTVEAGVAVAASGGTLHPVCALWRVRSFFLLGRYLAQGRRSLRGFAEQVGFVTADWPIAPVDPFLNVNTADDLAAAEALVGVLRS